jgi:divinyl chlorophyllide a 8-vinyl-reductase
MHNTPSDPDRSKRVLMVGATGTIGRATVVALQVQGHSVTCLIRPRSPDAPPHALPEGVNIRYCDVTDPAALRDKGIREDRFDVLLSCMASRTGAPDDAWRIDHRATVDAIEAAKGAGVAHVVLLSAICVQKPLLDFQRAKLATEQALIASGLTYSIVRPTAFFKSLSGQIKRLQAGKRVLLFGDGTLTACKPISDADLGRYLAECVTDPARSNCILPIGGPGPAITPLAQGEMLFRLMGQTPRFRRVPVRMMDGIIATLDALGHLSPHLRAKAGLARIGRYYATESMLLLNPETGRYEATATPETGSDTLADHYARVLRGEVTVDLGDHAVF